MMPLTEEDTQSHWSVTFSVDNADAVATRAVELGGQVIVAPNDAGPVRFAVLTDPQGAVFSVSRYQPA
jgi:predicted enzyme related to lactoylglutathione lyase